MAMSKGQESARGYSAGPFGHGGHHRKDASPAPVKKSDHMVNKANDGGMNDLGM